MCKTDDVRLIFVELNEFECFNEHCECFEDLPVLAVPLIIRSVSSTSANNRFSSSYNKIRGNAICVDDVDVLNSQFHDFGFFNFNFKMFDSLVWRSMGLPNVLAGVKDVVDDVIAFVVIHSNFIPLLCFLLFFRLFVLLFVLGLCTCVRIIRFESVNILLLHTETRYYYHPLNSSISFPHRLLLYS